MQWFLVPTAITVALSAPLSAQTTWIVDAAGGPGAAFTDLPPAFAAATSGDKILVRTGTYSGATTSAGINVQCEPGVRLGSGQTVRIVGLPATERFSIVGLGTGATPLAMKVLAVADCDGQVVIDRLSHLRGPTLFFINGPVVSIRNSKWVSLNSSAITDIWPIDIDGSEVHITNCSLQAIANGFSNTIGFKARNSFIAISETDVFGHNGTLGTEESAMMLDASIVLVTGSGARSIRAGLSCGLLRPCVPTLFEPAIVATGNTILVRNPTVPIGIVQYAVQIPLAFPALVSNGASLGNTMNNTLWPHATGNAIVVTSVPGPLRWTQLGPLWIEANHAVLFAGPVSAGQPVQIDVPISSTLFPREEILSVQALVIDASTGQGLLSNASCVGLF